MKGAFKVLGWIMPGLFRKQTEKYLTDFKNFAESKT
jgi:histone acetyltransferase (RNA polymerase elongator complex component)